MSAAHVILDRTYEAWLHFQPDASGATTVRVGFGRELHAACGQSEWIAVTSRPDLVECVKCKATWAYLAVAS